MMTEQAKRGAKGSISLLHLTKRQVSFEGRMGGSMKGKR